MIRPFTALCLMVAGGSGLYLYSAKHQAQVLDRQIAQVVHQADAIRERAGVLRAEYALLNDPERLGELASANLPALHTTAPAQFSTWSDFEKRLPAVGAPSVEPPEPLEPAAPAVATAAPVDAATAAPPHAGTDLAAAASAAATAAATALVSPAMAAESKGVDTRTARAAPLRPDPVKSGTAAPVPTPAPTPAPEFASREPAPLPLPPDAVRPKAAAPVSLTASLGTSARPAPMRSEAPRPEALAQPRAAQKAAEKSPAAMPAWRNQIFAAPAAGVTTAPAAGRGTAEPRIREASLPAPVSSTPVASTPVASAPVRPSRAQNDDAHGWGIPAQPRGAVRAGPAPVPAAASALGMARSTAPLPAPQPVQASYSAPALWQPGNSGNR